MVKPGRLRNIPGVLSPDLLHALASMGHGDDIGKEATFFFSTRYEIRNID
jgi:L-fucose mutarotase/ribose pyranase (RbsD/FucU family)